MSAKQFEEELIKKYESDGAVTTFNH